MKHFSLTRFFFLLLALGAGLAPAAHAQPPSPLTLPRPVFVSSTCPGSANNTSELRIVPPSVTGPNGAAEFIAPIRLNGVGLVVNGAGADDADPMNIYAMNSRQVPLNPFNPFPAPAFYRINLSSGAATLLGVVGAPPIPIGSPANTRSYVINQVADGAPGSRYYLTGVTLVLNNNTVSNVRFYLGEISLAPVPTPTTPVWKLVDVSDPGATAIITNFTAQTNAYLANPGNNPFPDGGIQDFAYVPATGNLVSYLGVEERFLTVSNITGATPVVRVTIPPIRLPLNGSTARQIGSIWRTVINGTDVFYALRSAESIAYRFDPLTGGSIPSPAGRYFTQVGCSVGDATTAAPEVTLPVTLAEFTAKAAAGGVQLAWRTASEQKVDRFVVERSPNGYDWTDLAATPATNRMTGSAYVLFDKDALTGTRYYRLRIEDLDGTRDWSSVSAVKGGPVGIVTLLPAWPNPARRTLSIALSAAQSGEASLANHLGQTVWRAPLLEGRTEADVHMLTPGIYELVVRYGAAQTAHQRVVVAGE